MVDSLKLKAPVFGPLSHKTALARFSNTLGMLLRSGVPILQALDIVSDTVGNQVISRAVSDVQGGVREGESIAKPLSKHPVFPPMVVQMLAVGEETGAVEPKGTRVQLQRSVAAAETLGREARPVDAHDTMGEEVKARCSSVFWSAGRTTRASPSSS